MGDYYNVHQTTSKTPPDFMAPLWDSYMELLLSDEPGSYRDQLQQASSFLAQETMNAMLNTSAALAHTQQTASKMEQEPVPVSFDGQPMGSYVPYAKTLPTYYALEGQLSQEYGNQAKDFASAGLLDEQALLDAYYHGMQATQNMGTMDVSTDVPKEMAQSGSAANDYAAYLNTASAGADVYNTLGNAYDTTSSLWGSLFGSGGSDGTSQYYDSDYWNAGVTLYP